MSDLAILFSTRGSLRLSLRSTYVLPGLPALLQTTEDAQYGEMEDAFRATGGIATSDEITALLHRRTDQPISKLARWIVNHEVLSFQWRSRTMLPLFQFDFGTAALHPAVTAVVRELVPVFSDWEVSLWFARRNAWLADAAPVDAINVDARAVHDAARAERFLTHG